MEDKFNEQKYHDLRMLYTLNKYKWNYLLMLFLAWPLHKAIIYIIY